MNARHAALLRQLARAVRGYRDAIIESHGEELARASFAYPPPVADARHRMFLALDAALDAGALPEEVLL